VADYTAGKQLYVMGSASNIKEIDIIVVRFDHLFPFMGYSIKINKEAPVRYNVDIMASKSSNMKKDTISNSKLCSSFLKSNFIFFKYRARQFII
jgi:hypothetical protein